MNNIDEIQVGSTIYHKRMHGEVKEIEQAQNAGFKLTVEFANGKIETLFVAGLIGTDLLPPRHLSQEFNVPTRYGIVFLTLTGNDSVLIDRFNGLGRFISLEKNTKLHLLINVDKITKNNRSIKNKLYYIIRDMEFIRFDFSVNVHEIAKEIVDDVAKWLNENTEWRDEIEKIGKAIEEENLRKRIAKINKTIENAKIRRSKAQKKLDALEGRL